MSLDQQRAFLLELGTSGNLTFACQAACVTRSEATTIRDANPLFERQWRAAEREARNRFNIRTGNA